MTHPKESVELLPCPFCGCTTINLVVQDERTQWYECDWCKSVGPVEQPDADPPEEWNIRAPQPDPIGAEWMRREAANGGRPVASMERQLLGVSAANCGATMIGAHVYVSQAAILAIPGPTPAQLLADALALEEVRAVVEDAFFEGFADGYDGGWIEGDPSHAWKGSNTLAKLKGTSRE